ncbi:malto-oligosyltrehalose trehalohydrolase [Aquabacter spiritensis]|uniref:Malto-oligosyltrehalose trehalohydrolase n=1 Tax=Aquabacter spiritensis TaxID=933073 RepID=A0A4R3M316_9HYPH|nr:malto-oligosyltrehalose trehalohydrolase [Aquabacter spiritensis]TCT05545.1 maltooligosyl trehalose hydrolase [Aquabacter spiritensis]
MIPDDDRPDAATSRFPAMPFGAAVTPAGVRFRFYAPAQRRVLLHVGGATVEMAAAAEGWHALLLPEVETGARYRFELEDGLLVPDPASRFQPEDCHGPSEVIDPARYAWRDTDWTGRPWHEAILYELHVGTFTSEGTFRAAIDRLDDLVELGITAIELMPVADFPGPHNWGYDGVLLYAPDAAYGRPDDLRALVDAAHARGLMVLLDVVYNHFGPDGNYLGAYAPSFFTERHHTPWGAALNYDGPDSRPVRDFMIHNALYWIDEFHFDGLRLDAVHAIIDDSAEDLLAELSRRVRAAHPGRQIHLVLENEENAARRLGADVPGGFTAQWNDDVHHGLHVAVTGEGDGYYADYRADFSLLPRALAEGFAFQGEVMAYRGHGRGEPSGALPPAAFVAFLQNHDQIGNRAFGERIAALAPAAAVRAAAALYLLGPQVPMLFMGEEWGSTQPFPFFCGFTGDLADAVREGRRAEFARFPAFADPAVRATIPDPMAEATFLSAALDWSARDDPAGQAWLDWYRRALQVRREQIWPLAGRITAGGQYRMIGPTAFEVVWSDAAGPVLWLRANLGPEEADGLAEPAGAAIWREGDLDAGRAGPWSVGWFVRAAEGM